MEKQKETMEQDIINHNEIAELPCLKLSITKGSSDFIQKQIQLEVKGYTFTECIESMDYLIKKTKELK